MSTLNELPENIHGFLAFIGFSKLITLSADEMSQFSDSYDTIKSLERDRRRFIPEVQALLNAIGLVEGKSFHNLEQIVQPRQDYEALFHDELPDKFKPFIRRIWFHDYLCKELVLMEMLRDWYSRLRISTRQGNGTARAQAAIIKILRPVESRYLLDIARNERRARNEHNKRVSINSASRLAMVKEALPEINLAEELKISKPTATEALRNLKSAPEIGLGLMSGYTPRRIRRDEVSIDANTAGRKNHSKHILYVPGWSVEGAFHANEPE
ncbi:MAG: hypothetical protein K2X80_10790 [Pseudomonadaceae bacterium]|nr:hypothetical protein [Pseudomonadaceae bacterium]